MTSLFEDPHLWILLAVLIAAVFAVTRAENPHPGHLGVLRRLARPTRQGRLEPVTAHSQPGVAMISRAVR